MLWGAMATGFSGWLLVAAGAGKISAWSEWTEACGEDDTFPQVLRRPLRIVWPTLELLAGVLVLLYPHRDELLAGGLLLTLVAWHQSERMQQGRDPDSHAFGRIRRVRLVPAVVAMHTVLAFSLFATALAWNPGPLGARLGHGLFLCAVYLLVAGLWRWRPEEAGLPDAERRYVEERLAGRSDVEARQVLAEKYGLRLSATYLLIPAQEAWWLLWKAGRSAPTAQRQHQA